MTGCSAEGEEHCDSHQSEKRFFADPRDLTRKEDARQRRESSKKQEMNRLTRQ